jgi:hypothetical protein
MARIRNIKPDFWTDEKLVELDPVDRLLFIGLWNFSDDEGFLPYSPKRIKMQIFPADSLEISVGLQNLISIGALTLYDYEGGQVLHVTNWSKHQKVSNPTKSKFSGMVLTPVDQKPRKQAVPAPEITEPSTPVTELSREVHKEREREREGERERVVKTCPATQDEFIDWYLIYPRKEGKGVAEKAYAKARKKVSAEVLAAGAQRYADDPNREKQFTKLPATWLNAESWDDEPLPDRNGTVTPLRPTGAQNRLQAGFDLLQQTRAEKAQRQQQFEIGQ